MRILYGVQGTGNGHITRALAMAKAFAETPQVQVDYLISGRARNELFGVETLGDYQWRPGLSFATRDGRISILDTISHNPWWQFWHDVNHLDLSGYDLVISDFEPVSAWAAKRQHVPCVGLGRQYCFYHAHRQLPVNSLQRAMIKQFAPCDLALGTHWQQVSPTTLPPLIEPKHYADQVEKGRYLVYLPFQPLADIKALLARFSDYQFDVYHPNTTHCVTENAVYYAPSRDGFKQAFSKAEGIISNAGFGTSSEALAAGKKLLVKPLKGQFEQQANAHYLASAGLATVAQSLSPSVIAGWLHSSTSAQLTWPEVAPTLAKWLAKGDLNTAQSLSQQLWQLSNLTHKVA